MGGGATKFNKDEDLAQDEEVAKIHALLQGKWSVGKDGFGNETFYTLEGWKLTQSGGMSGSMNCYLTKDKKGNIRLGWGGSKGMTIQEGYTETEVAWKFMGASQTWKKV